MKNDQKRLYHVSNWFLRRKKTKRALDLFKLYVKSFPQSYLAYAGLGETYRLMGKKKQAVENFKKVLRIDPKNAYAIEKLKLLDRYSAH